MHTHSFSMLSLGGLPTLGEFASVDVRNVHFGLLTRMKFGIHAFHIPPAISVSIGHWSSLVSVLHHYSVMLSAAK